MKTTIDIADRLLRDAKREAARRGTTLKEVVESALRRHLDEVSAPSRFQLRDGSIEGRGVQAGIEEGDWEGIRALIYEGRGA
jgi:Arc/MetJ family transcription regulator